MTFRNPYRLVLELMKRDGSALGQAPVQGDWQPALECARFEALRRFNIPVVGHDAIAELHPVWDTRRGAPYLGAFEIALNVPGAGEVRARMATGYFKEAARRAVLPFVKSGKHDAGEGFDYLVAAFSDVPPAPKSTRARFTLEEVLVPLPIRDSSLSEFRAGSVLVGTQDAQDIHVFIPQVVLEETRRATEEAGASEAAAILIGHHHRDRDSGDLFLEITAQIPALHAVTGSTKVTFTPDTWTAVQRMVDLRQRDEQMLGWFHSHPAKSWCNPNCSTEARRQCPWQRTFFSADDCDVHRTVFSRAWNVALLITNTDGGLEHSAFSWRNGVVAERGFHLRQTLNGTAAPAPQQRAGTATIGEPEHEKNCID